MSKRVYRLEDRRKKKGLFGLLFLLFSNLFSFICKAVFNKPTRIIYKKVAIFVTIFLLIVVVISMFNNNLEPTLTKQVKEISIPTHINK